MNRRGFLGLLGATALVPFLPPVAAKSVVGTITFPVAPAAGDTITLNGRLFTFATSRIIKMSVVHDPAHWSVPE